MSTEFSAAPSALGYLYQARYALYLILDGKEESEISIESLDDVVFEEGISSRELLQLKHHTRQAALTDSSPDLWKTIRVWSADFQSPRAYYPETLLTLVTTAEAPDGSIAAFLRPSKLKRDEGQALQMLRNTAASSSNQGLRTAFEAFMSLSFQQQEMLVNSIQVLDCSPNISDTAAGIKKKIEVAVRREHLDDLYERLEGWWFDQVIRHLSGGSVQPIARFEVHDKIVDIAEQFRPDALPIDFLYAVPPVPPDPEGDNRRFVLQLKEIALNSRRIENAILDYYRAFEQRSRWAREDLLIGGELERYERKLQDEWQRHRLALQDEIEIDEASEENLQRVGKELYKWMELEADIRIRPEVTEAYVMRGSYHILADQCPPCVWWHPKFVERLLHILALP